MNNIFIAKIFNDITHIRSDSQKIEKEVLRDEYRISYEPHNTDSTNTAIDYIIKKIIDSEGCYQRFAKTYGIGQLPTRIELIVAREDETIISDININNAEEINLDLFDKVYKFLRDNFYFI